MDASVNMKMTPDEHRLLRESLLVAQGEHERYARETPDIKDRVEARNRAAQIASLLTKI